MSLRLFSIAPSWMLSAALLAGTVANLWAGPTISVGHNPKSGIDIKMSRAYETLPSSGFLPVTIEIKNDTELTRSWTFRFESMRHHGGTQEITGNYVRQFTVKPKASGTFKLLVPLAPPSSSSSLSSQLYFQASGHGITNTDSTFLASTSHSKDRTPYFLLGNDWGVHIWGRLQTRILSSSSARDLDGSRVMHTDLPEDWRGYAGCALVMLSEEEWGWLNPEQKNALKNWVGLGGSLAILTESLNTNLAVLLDEPTENLTFSRKGIPTLPLGFGLARMIFKEGMAYPEQTLVSLILNPNPAYVSDRKARNSYVTSWGLAEQISGIAANQGLMLIFVVLFAALIGPINLFFLANKKHRYRLFWTTPAISVGASLLLLFAILIFDGLGGTGRRMVAAVVLPHQNQLALFQEQISRSAVLMGAGFQINQPASIQQIILSGDGRSLHTIERLRPDGSINSIYSAELAQRGSLGFYQDQDWYSGDYFQSRAVQAQTLAAIQPSRHRLDLLREAGEESPPVVSSSFAGKLATVFYRDQEGKLWQLEGLVPGQQAEMQPATSQDFDPFWNKQIELAGGILAPKLRAVRQRQGYFYAEAEPGSRSPALNTLTSIRWTDGPVLYLGQIHPQGEATP